MKTFKSMKHWAWAVVLPLGLAAVSTTSQAFEGEGSITVSNGKSTLAFNPEFFNLFPTLGATLGSYGKATFEGSLNKQNQRITFPIAAATVNPSRAPQIPFYDFDHQGGLTMDRGDGTLSVVFNNPSLRTTADCLTPLAQCLELGATLISNGRVYGYLSNFAQSTEINAFQLKGGNLRVDNVGLYLSDAGAIAMNEFFKLLPTGDIYFKKGYPFGTLNAVGKGFKVICPPGESYKKNPQECR